MPKLLLSLLFVFSTAMLALAQDPGFQPPTVPSKPTQPTAVPDLNRSDEARGAGLVDNMERLDGSTVLQANDKLSFRIVEEGNVPISGRILESGDFQSPHVGLVKAAGKTPKALAFEIKRLLEGTYFRKATVIIALDERPKPPPGQRGGGVMGKEVEFFTIYGQVIRQGKYELPFDEDVTVSQAILRAGGFSQFADTKKVRVIRKTPQGNKTILVNVDQIMTKGELDRDIYIRNDDVVIIKENPIQF